MLRRHARLIALMLVGGCASLRGAGPSRPGPAEAEIIRLVNLHRQQRGRERLHQDPALTRIAREQSRAMAAGSRPFSHDGLRERARKAAPLLDLGENLLAMQPASPSSGWQAVGGWLGSPAHRRTLEGCYNRTGVGVASDPAGRVYFTQLFALRREPGRAAPACAP